MSLRRRFGVCVHGERAFPNRYIFEMSAKNIADISNGIAGKLLYHVHPEADFDATGRCPHFVPADASFDLHRAALPALGDSAADRPRLAALLNEIERNRNE